MLRSSAAKRGGRRGHEIGDGARRAGSFDVGFAKVDQVALDLRLARPSQVGALDRNAVKGIRAEQHLMRAKDFAYSRGNASSERRNSSSGSSSGVAI
jgi:hypothetical protein